MEVIDIQDFSIVTKTKTKRLKRKTSFSKQFVINSDTVKLWEKLNEQIDKAEVEAKKAAMTYIVR